MELNKHQQREAEQHAKDNGVSLDAAYKALFPEYDVPAVPAAEEQPADADAAKGAKASTSK